MYGTSTLNSTSSSGSSSSGHDTRRRQDRSNFTWKVVLSYLIFSFDGEVFVFSLYFLFLLFFVLFLARISFSAENSTSVVGKKYLFSFLYFFISYFDE